MTDNLIKVLFSASKAYGPRSCDGSTQEGPSGEAIVPKRQSHRQPRNEPKVMTKRLEGFGLTFDLDKDMETIAYCGIIGFVTSQPIKAEVPPRDGIVGILPVAGFETERVPNSVSTD